MIVTPSNLAPTAHDQSENISACLDRPPDTTWSLARLIDNASPCNQAPELSHSKRLRAFLDRKKENAVLGFVWHHWLASASQAIATWQRRLRMSSLACSPKSEGRAGLGETQCNDGMKLLCGHFSFSARPRLCPCFPPGRPAGVSWAFVACV